MKKILSHKRFALFAPFIALAALTLMAFALWIIAAGRIADELSANGFSWQKLTREGFPARISLYWMPALARWRDGVAKSGAQYDADAL